MTENRRALPADEPVIGVPRQRRRIQQLPGFFHQLLRFLRSLYEGLFISAAGFLQSVLGCLIMIVANAIVRKVDRESALF